ncbi:hypothetical protein CN515_04945 [Bacillus cereus]|uniref:helix-turn-helix transcriptional regulator n=1 Tax=Bacillus cereus TaxID=1396 RepID=UPI000BF61A54|nr:helix-turn-helix transcriptional regulator [Bacillus cereus]PES55395.1 hypothetical protein CN515_04945 [Bacillus cereus]
MKIKDFDELKRKGYVIVDGEITVTNKVEEILKERGLEQADLAKMTGLSKQYISSVIKENVKPGIDSAIKIAYVLDMAVEELFHLKEIGWTSGIKETGEETLFLDLYEMEIIRDKKMEQRTNDEIENSNATTAGYTYFDKDTNEKVSKERYDEMLELFISERIHQEIENVKNALERGMAKKAVESRAKKQLQAEFNKRYTERYKKLDKIVMPLVNKRK